MMWMLGIELGWTYYQITTVIIWAFIASIACGNAICRIIDWRRRRRKERIRIKGAQVTSSSCHGFEPCNFARLLVNPCKDMRIDAKVIDFQPADRYEPVPFELHWARNISAGHAEAYRTPATTHQRMFHSVMEPLEVLGNSEEPLDIAMYLPTSNRLFIMDYRIGEVKTDDFIAEIELVGDGITCKHRVHVWIKDGEMMAELC